MSTFTHTVARARTQIEGDEEDQIAFWPADWDLPAALAPYVYYVPNRNLLRWLPLRPGYTREMAAILERYGCNAI